MAHRENELRIKQCLPFLISDLLILVGVGCLTYLLKTNTKKELEVSRCIIDMLPANSFIRRICLILFILLYKLAYV